MSAQVTNLFSVRGKTIVISGGGTGLGRMLAEGFVENGARVVIIGRRAEVLDQAVREMNEEYASVAGGSVYAVQGDIATKDGVRAIVERIAEREDKVDGLINNAAIQRPWRNPITDHRDPDAVERLVWDGVEDEDWDFTQRVNVNGAYFLTAGLVPLLRKSPDPSVIIISSIAAIANQRPVSSLTYGVSKAAALHLCSMLAGRLSPLKIRVNAILPGTFPTEITSTASPTPEDPKHRTLLPAAGKVALRTPLGRAGAKEDILGPCIMLCSRAGGFTTNAVISVDGGRSMNAGIDDGIRLPDEFYH
ncbi:hypothetical protein DB88DRAFT_498088 [Papiliotrema laurentii]|uniref:Uncharacterized protein n=1 Tax=Papiliotrema laurentii TaxID=5418 RepID=A0AAD9FQ27_PAPLA|nr:hypothetical protein DB88DRAFT_498088 [Papiliotrema laurentii]